MSIEDTDLDLYMHVALSSQPTSDQCVPTEGNDQHVADLLRRIAIDPNFGDAHRVKLIRFLSRRTVGNIDNAEQDELIERILCRGYSGIPTKALCRLLCSITATRRLSVRYEQLRLDGALPEIWTQWAASYREEQEQAIARVRQQSPFSPILTRRAIEIPCARSLAKLPEGLRQRIIKKLHASICEHEALMAQGKSIDDPEWVAADVAFHSVIIGAVGGEIAVDWFRDVHEAVHELLVSARKHLEATESPEQTFIDEHAEIVDAMSSGDLLKIEYAYDNHLGRVASELGKEAETLYMEARRDRALVAELVSQRETMGVHRAFRSLRTNDTYIVVITSGGENAREFEDPVAFGPEVAMALHRGASILYLIEKALPEAPELRKGFEALKHEASEAIGSNISDITFKRLAIAYGSTARLIPEGCDELHASPFGITARADGTVSLDGWKSGNRFLLNYNDLAEEKWGSRIFSRLLQILAGGHASDEAVALVKRASQIALTQRPLE